MDEKHLIIAVLWKCFVCPQNVNLPILSIRAFMNENNSLTLGLYRRLIICFMHGHLALSLLPGH